MAPNTRRKTAPKAKSKLNISALLDNDAPAIGTALNSCPKRTTSVTSLMEYPPVPITHSQPLLQLATINIQADVGARGKGKGKDKQDKVIRAVEDHAEDSTEYQLWTDKYAPQTQSELAVHKRKIDDVRHWLKEALGGGPSGTLKKYRRILALTGPAGTGKTATLKVLAKELGFNIVEWKNAIDDHFAGDWEDYDYESLMFKFQSFINRASSCRALNLSAVATDQSTSTHSEQKRIILLEDLPNILHPDTAIAFHAALEEFVSLDNGIPLVCIISDSGLRGEDPGNTSYNEVRGRWDKQVIDVRSVIPRSVFTSIYFREIRYNSIAPTIMAKALATLAARHFDTQEPPSARCSKKILRKPSKEVIQLLAESSNGDIRSAVMALQFASVIQASKADKGNTSTKALLEAVCRREQSLALFQLLGKVLYNKRKGDPPSSSATARERGKLEEDDRRLKDPPVLPDHLSDHYRKASRVDVNVLYADSPIDSSLFALYLHQNYNQFCDDIDQCDAIAERMSWADSVFPELSQSIHTPYQFYLTTLNALHYLPYPVPRLSQKLYKPAFFENLRDLREAEGAVVDVEGWLDGLIEDGEGGSRVTRKWSREEVVLELGGLLRVCERGVVPVPIPVPPSTHVKFSSLTFVHPAKRQTSEMEQLNESEDAENFLTQGNVNSGFAMISSTRSSHSVQKTRRDDSQKWWLKTDDIADF